MKRLITTMMIAVMATATWTTVARADEPVRPTRKTTNRPGVWKDAKESDIYKTLEAAKLDGLRQLAERIYGVEVDGYGSMQDFVLQNQLVKARMEALLKGADIIGEPDYTEEGIVYVTCGLTMRKVYEVIDTNLMVKNGEVKVYDYDRKLISEDREIKALGNSALPGSQGMRMILAKRAAEVDAYRNLAQKLMGVHLTSKSTVRDFMLASDEIRSRVSAVLYGLKPTSIEYNDKDACEVEMQLKVRHIYEIIDRVIKQEKGLFRTKTETVTTITKKVEDEIMTAKGLGAPRETTDRVIQQESEAVDADVIKHLHIKRLVGAGFVVD